MPAGRRWLFAAADMRFPVGKGRRRIKSVIGACRARRIVGAGRQRIYQQS